MFRLFSLSCFLSVGFLAISLSSHSVFAQTIACDSTYAVERGDNLSSIAQRAYGNQGLAQYLYDVNWRVVGDDPSQLQPGDRLSVPCIGSGPEDDGTDGDEGTGTSEAIGPISRPSQVIAFLTAEDFAPFTDKAFPEGGMLAKVVKDITSEPIEGRKGKVYWINDWSAHLKTLLLERNAFDAAFPWYKPDCSKPEALDENGIFRCKNFRFSDPLYKVLVPFFTKADNRLDPQTAEDMRGQRVCRPKGYFTFDLAQKGLIDPGGDASKDLITLVKADTPTDCFRQLMDDKVDFVTVNALLAATPIRELGIDTEIVERDGLSSAESLHVIVPRELPEGTVMLHEINQRLRALRETDEYNRIRRLYLEIYFGEQS